MFEAYLNLLRLQRNPPTKQFLFKLVRAHLQRVPLENLDFYYHRKPVLDVEKVIKKMSLKRGGIGLHLNAALYKLLDYLGYEAELRSVQPFDANSRRFLPRLSGVSIVVKVEAVNYFIDLGKVDGLTSPLAIVPDTIQLNGNQYFKWEVKPFDEHLYLNQSNNAFTFSNNIQLEPKAVNLIEYLSVHDDYQKKEHLMSKRRTMYKRLEQGHVSIIGNELEILELGQRKVIQITNEEEFWSLSDQHFGISYEDVFSQ
jgi:N-hydroxyarylamine O-acetyltransferase